MNRLQKVKQALKNSVSISQEKAAYFFKTGAGQYAEGDRFIGVTVPSLRKIANEFNDLELEEISLLLMSKINEARLLALIILVKQYQNSSVKTRRIIYHFYIDNLSYVNNWNLVDASAHWIVGAYLFDKKNKNGLIKLARSNNLWYRRVAIVSTWYFIKEKELDWTFRIAEMLLNEEHDLIHKAAGWMLREAGKRDHDQLCLFLDKYADIMPRTMLRYAIERFESSLRNVYMQVA